MLSIIELFRSFRTRSKSTVFTISPHIMCRSNHTIQFLTSPVTTTHHPPRPLHVHHTTRPSRVIPHHTPRLSPLRHIALSKQLSLFSASFVSEWYEGRTLTFLRPHPTFRFFIAISYVFHPFFLSMHILLTDPFVCLDFFYTFFFSHMLTTPIIILNSYSENIPHLYYKRLTLPLYISHPHYTSFTPPTPALLFPQRYIGYAGAHRLAYVPASPK